MDPFKLFAIALLCVSAAAVLKQLRAELLPPLRIAAILLLIFGAILAADPLFSYLRTLGEIAILSEHTAVLFKAVGLAILTQYCAELCRECGENGIAGGVELVGKVEVLLLALPFLEEILQLVNHLLELGGGT